MCMFSVKNRNSTSGLCKSSQETKVENIVNTKLSQTTTFAPLFVDLTLSWTTDTSFFLIQTSFSLSENSWVSF